MSSPRGSVAHQFDDAVQQTESARLGMWAFLVSEIVFFGGLFTGYVVYRTSHPEAFAEGSHHLDVLLGGINTAVLIASSLTMALAVYGAENGRRGRVMLFLMLTMFLGSTFLVIKWIEYGHKFEEYLVPGPSFVSPLAALPQVELFFSFYFTMTGLHALHMIIGVGVLTVLLVMVARRRAENLNANAIEMSGLYWHFVDIVWIFLFPLLYLIGRHGS